MGHSPPRPNIFFYAPLSSFRVHGKIRWALHLKLLEPSSYGFFGKITGEKEVALVDMGFLSTLLSPKGMLHVIHPMWIPQAPRNAHDSKANPSCPNPTDTAGHLQTKTKEKATFKRSIFDDK